MGMWKQLDSREVAAELVSRDDADRPVTIRTRTLQKHESPYNINPRTPPLNTFDEEIENGLSPLSPNVCIERGPSRYHSNRSATRIEQVSTPCKKPLPRHQQSQENVFPWKDSTVCVESPLVARNNWTRLF